MRSHFVKLQRVLALEAARFCRARNLVANTKNAFKNRLRTLVSAVAAKAFSSPSLKNDADSLSRSAHSVSPVVLAAAPLYKDKVFLCDGESIS